MKEQKPLKHSSDIPKIYEEYNNKLKNYISQRVNFWEDVEDILQNTFYKLIQVDLEAHPIEKISSWLYTVAQNQIIDHYKKKKEESFPSLLSEDDNNEFVEDLRFILSEESDSPEIQYLQSVVWVELESTLDELPIEQRKVFELTELEGFSFKEISESTGIPVNTLLSRKRYAILYLREKLRYLYEEIILHT